MQPTDRRCPGRDLNQFVGATELLDGAIHPIQPGSQNGPVGAAYALPTDYSMRTGSPRSADS